MAAIPKATDVVQAVSKKQEESMYQIYLTLTKIQRNYQEFSAPVMVREDPTNANSKLVTNPVKSVVDFTQMANQLDQLCHSRMDHAKALEGIQFVSGRYKEKVLREGKGERKLNRWEYVRNKIGEKKPAEQKRLISELNTLLETLGDQIADALNKLRDDKEYEHGPRNTLKRYGITLKVKQEQPGLQIPIVSSVPNFKEKMPITRMAVYRSWTEQEGI